MRDDQYNAIRTVARYAFAMIDTELYLDAYPNDGDALAYYTEMKKARDAAVADYEDKYGPLTADSAASAGQKWRWTDGPWPWQTSKGGCTSCGRM